MPLSLKPPDECRWDAVALGEVMLRLDPGPTRIHTARQFSVWEGGGEYNVVRGLRKCFGLRTAVVTAIVDNEVGHLLEDLMMQGGVDLSHVKWVPFDGIGRAARVGLNFTERGYGIRPAVGCSDRAYSAASQMKPGDVDWQRIFRDEGARWFHCGDSFASGLVYALLSGKSPQDAVCYGAAHGALAMTTPGDTSMVTLKEVQAAMKGKGARVIR